MKKKRENTIREFWTLNKELLHHACFQQPQEWEENVWPLLRNLVNLFLQNERRIKRGNIPQQV